MEDKNHELLERKLCKEIEIIESKYMNGAAEMTVQDIEKLDKIYHTLKSMATYNAMKEAEEYEQEGVSGARMTYSGRRGRGADGRYVSRDTGESYADGYSRGYSEAMNQMQGGGNGGSSGHYPPMNYYPRW